MSSNFKNHQQAILILLVYVGIFSAFSITLQDLFSRWTKWDQSQSHGLVVLAVTIYLYCQRFNPALLKPRPAWFAVAALGLLSLFWLIAAAVNIDIIEQLCLFSILVVLQFVLFQKEHRWTMVSPILFVIFAVPVWDYLSPFLVELSSLVVTSVLHKSSITAYIEGSSIFLPYGTIVIADGCSGLRYLTVALALSYYLVITSSLTRSMVLKIIALAVVLGLLVNWIRIYSLVLIGYYTRMKSSLIEDHEMYGWILFFIVLAPLVILARKLPLYIPPVTEGMDRVIIRYRTYTLVLVVSVCGPVIFLGISTGLEQPRIEKLSNTNEIEAQGYEVLDKPIRSIPAPDWQVSVAQEEAGARQTLSTGLYWQKVLGDSLVPYLPDIYNRDVWRLKSRDKLKLIKNINARGESLVNKNTGRIKHVLYWFRLGRFSTGNYKLAKLLQIPAVFLGINDFEFTRLEGYCKDETCKDTSIKLTELAETWIVTHPIP